MKSARCAESIFSALLVVFLVTAIIILPGCATGPAYSKIESIPEGKSLVYFYRPSRFFAGARSPAIYDNGTEILGGLSNGGYWVYYVEPGKHSFSTEADYVRSSNVTIESEGPGEAYYIRMDMLAGLVSSTAKLYRVYPEQGEEEITKCNLAE